MEINFDNKDEKAAYSLSEINELKKDLIPENFVTTENKNKSMTINKNDYFFNELKIEKNENYKDEIKSEQKNKNNSEEDKKSNDEKHISNENNSKKNEKNEEIIEKSLSKNEEEQKEENKEAENKEEEKIQDLIPLWYKCLNKEHSSKYITLDRKKTTLICKNCYMSGVLETNLELNQEFIDNYLKEQELRKENQDISKDAIKETLEENVASESEENKNKINSVEENESKIKNDDIKCLTFQCLNKPYYFCEPCQDFICYYCIMQRMDEKTDKSRHYYHDIESVNYESNSFKDDIKLELETINKINTSLDYLMNNEKKRIEKFLQKYKEENKNELSNYLININKKIKSIFLENNKDIFDKYKEKAFNNVDINIKDLEFSSKNAKSNIEKKLIELNRIKEEMNKKNITTEEKCDLHQKYIDLIKNVNELIQKGNNIIARTNEELNHLNDNNTKKIIEEEDSLSNNLLSENKKSIIQSLSNNSKKQGSYKLNRFVTYKHEGLKYFGVTSLELICQKDIILCGLFVCGKYLSSKKLKQTDYSNIPKEERDFININIKIYEKGIDEPLINENKKLYEIVEVNDPVVDIIFEKGIKIKREVKYIIVIENLEQEKFTDLWIGKVFKKLINDNKQTIRCNNSNIIFDFFMPKEHISDFNEFEQGIIEGILYGN
jgi:hypothetical protein